MSADLAAAVARQEWYHTIELPGGVVTPGFFDHRPVLEQYELPAKLDGLRVLDAGTFDGFFAFEMERRGAAEVVAIDVPTLDDLDWPEPLRRLGYTRFQPRHQNFDIAKSALGSNVRREFISVYDLSPERLGIFDYVFVGSLLIHLRDPVRALAALRSVNRSTIHLAEATHRWLNLVSRRLPAAKFQAISDHLTWWIPNKRCLADWLSAAGYLEVKHGKTFVVPFAQLPGGVRHSVVFAQNDAEPELETS